MIIGFDAKRIFDNATGLGSYGRSLVHNLIKWYPQHDYRLFVHQDYYLPSPYKYQDFIDKTVTSTHFLPNLWRSTEIAKDILKNKIEIYHGLSSELPFSLPTQVKSIVTVHDLIYEKFQDDFPLLDRSIYRYKVKRACKESSAIVAVSESTRRDLVELYKVPQEKIFVIYPSWGREYEYEYSSWFGELLKQKYAIPFQFVLFVGTISHRKNLKIVIDALSYPENSELPLVIVSQGGNMSEEIERYIENKEVKHRCFFLDDVPWYELPGLYRAARCVVYPSLYEGFGLPVIESLKMETPAVISDNSSLREAGGDAVIYADAKDTEAWASAINRVVLDTTLRDDLIAKGKEYIKRFEPAVVTTAMMDIYSWVHDQK